MGNILFSVAPMVKRTITLMELITEDTTWDKQEITCMMATDEVAVK